MVRGEIDRCRRFGPLPVNFGELLERDRRLVDREIHDEDIPTRKDALVNELNDRLGFQRARVDDSQAALCVLEAAAAELPAAYLSLKEAGLLVESA